MKSWEDHWATKDIPWDAGKESPALASLVKSLDAKQALVPGCGTGHDVFALASQGIETTGLDIAPSAEAAFVTERSKRNVDATLAQIQIGNFFDLDETKKFDFIWDYTFLCAIDREEREAWANKMKTLLAEGGQLATLVFPIFDADDDYEGPPWPLTPGLVRGLLEPIGFRCERDEEVSESNPGREGKERLCVWRVA